jgi:hypothetical protein
MELVAIVSFTVVFFIAILWASRRPVDDHH